MSRRTLMIPLTVGATVMVAASVASTQVGTAGLVLRGATIYAAPDAAAIRDGVVVIRGGRIDAVGSAAAIAPPAGLPVFDLAGLTLVAGFWNSHVHFRSPLFAAEASAGQLADAMRDMLTSRGFTTVIDTGSVLTNTLALRARVEKGDVDGPRIFTTGDILYPAGAKSGGYEPATPGDATAAVTALVGGGADAVKVYAQTFWDLTLTLSPDTLAAVRTETPGAASTCSRTPRTAKGSTTRSTRVSTCSSTPRRRSVRGAPHGSHA